MAPRAREHCRFGVSPRRSRPEESVLSMPQQTPRCLLHRRLWHEQARDFGANPPPLLAQDASNEPEALHIPEMFAAHSTRTGARRQKDQVLLPRTIRVDPL